MLIFFVLLTLGFVFELGKGALNIESRQNTFKEQGTSAKIFIFLQQNKTEQDLLVKILFKKNLNSHVLCRNYSKDSRKGTGFWRKAKSLDESDINNPFM